MREYILIEKRYLKLPTIRFLSLIHFAYLVLIFCDRKLLNSTAGHLFLPTFPTQHLFCDRKLLKSTAGNLFLHTLPTRHFFGSRKILRMRITTAGHADTTFVNCNEAAWQLMEFEVSELYYIK